MSDTRPNITIPANTWVNIYEQLNLQAGFPSVSIGTKIRVKLIGGGEVKLVTKATQPTDFSAYDVLVSRSVPVTNQPGDSGAWAYSVGASTIINVEVF